MFLKILMVVFASTCLLHLAFNLVVFGSPLTQSLFTPFRGHLSASLLIHIVSFFYSTIPLFLSTWPYSLCFGQISIAAATEMCFSSSMQDTICTAINPWVMRINLLLMRCWHGASQHTWFFYSIILMRLSVVSFTHDLVFLIVLAPPLMYLPM